MSTSSTLSVDDTVTITLTLTDAFASADNLRLPLQEPNRRWLSVGLLGVCSGSTQRVRGGRKVLSYTAHPAGPGPALIGPVVLHGSGGQIETLPPVAIQVLPDLAGGEQ